MKQKPIRIVILVLCVLMLAALLLPLVSVLSYGWNLSEMLQKLPSLMKLWQSVLFFVVAVGLVVSPVLVAFGVLWRCLSLSRCGGVAAFGFIVVLMLMTVMSGSKLVSAYGSYIYLFASLTAAVLAGKIKKTAG